MSELLYLYGFVPARAGLPPDGLAGVGEAPVELLPLDGVSAVVGRLPARDFAAAALEQRTQDLSWVAEQGLAHERVVAWFVDHAEILPAPLFTLYSSPSALREEGARRGAELEDALRRLAGKREWDLKISYAPDALAAHLGEVSAEVAELDRRIADATPGTRFLLERKRETLVQAEMARAARRLAGELLGALDPLAARTVLLPVASGESSLPVVLNAALLVPVAEAAAAGEIVRGRAAGLEQLGMRVAFSGPWAPYRFLGERGEDGG